MNPRTLTYWKWLLTREQKGTGDRKARARGAETAAPPASAFVEIQQVASHAAFELALGNGRRLQIPQGFEAGALERLLSVLERK